MTTPASSSGHFPRPLRAALVLLIACVVHPSRLSPVATADATDTVGIPFTGEAGVSETVSEIMDRDVPAASPTPAVAPSEPAAPVPAAPQTVGASFLGVQLSESGFIPPDSMGAVGPTQVMVITNGRIKIFDKTGVLGPLNTTTDNFFASVRTAGTSDPHVRYDRLSQRWFVVMIDVAATSNKCLIAMSSGPIITGAASFTFFRFAEDFDGGNPGQFFDYPTLGVDANALYIGAVMFSSSVGSFVNIGGFVVRKSSLTSGGPIVVTSFRGIDGGAGQGIYLAQGVDNDDPLATEGYFIGPSNLNFGELVMRRISTPGATPTISGNLVITVPATSNPIASGQDCKGDTKHLDTIDLRLFAAAIHKNKITGVNSLWTAHHIEVNTSGVAQSGGGYNAARWYELGSLTTTPALVQSGTLFDVGANHGYLFPTVIASGQGHMALGATYAGQNHYAGVATTGRFRTDPLGLTQPETYPIVSSTAYTLSESGSVHRWGDFSQTVVDPTDDQTIWTFQEYCNATASWGVQAIQLRAPTSATPASAVPASVAQGATSVSVVVTGTSVAGTEFFDPGADLGGPGFANHIAASVGGTGVTVNSVTFNSPTQVTLNVTVGAGAALGARTITVTNPDGQSATSATGILTITAGTPVPVVTCTTSVTAMQPSGGGLINVGLAVTSSDPAATKTIAVYSNDNNLTGTSTSFFFNGGFYYPKPAAAQLFGSTLLLRADRYAQPGRVYLIVAKATNAGGTGFASTTVVVPYSAYFLVPPATITAPAAAAKAYCDANAGAPPPGPLPPSGSGYDTHLVPTTIP